MGGSEPKRHHYVPRSYLRNFADSHDQLVTVDLDSGKRFPQSVERAAAEIGFNTVEMIDGTKSAAGVERVLSQFEGAGMAAVSAVLNGQFPLKAQKRADLANFLGLQTLRSPAKRDQADQLATELYRLEVAGGGPAGMRAALQRATGQPPTDEDVARAWEGFKSTDLRVKMPTNHHVKFLLESAEHAAQILADRNWCLTRFERRTLMTSDTPVSLHRWPTAENQFYGLGLMNADEIWVPLSRRVALCITPHLAEGVSLPPTFAGALTINTIVANNARRWLFFHPADDPTDGIRTPPRGNTIRVSGLRPEHLALESERRQGYVPPGFVDIAEETE